MNETVGSVSLVEEFEQVKQRSLSRDALGRLVGNKAAVLGAFIAIAILLMASVGPFLAPYRYTKTNVERMAEPPSGDHWMGTDIIGRDIFSRMLHASRTAVFVAFITIAITSVLGVFFGSIAAWRGGWIDDLIMRIVDTLYGLPDLLIAALLAVSLRRPVAEWLSQLQTKTQWGFLSDTVFVDYLLVFGALSMVNWSGYARLIRGQLLSLREREFILAEYALGLPTTKIIKSHLIPNGMSPVIVSITLSVGGIMVSESSLSFLGLGVQPPGASWGGMIADSLEHWRTHPHLVAMPGLMLAVAVFGFNFLGDGVNDALNPRAITR